MLFGLLTVSHAGQPADVPQPTQYILFNRAPGQGMYQGRPETLGRRQFDEVLAEFPNRPGAPIQTGLSFVFSPFRTPPETTVKALRIFLEAAEQTETPIVVQIDLEHWWQARPDLWNWWDPEQPGYDPANRENVEWTGWSPDAAIKIAWRNWGRQIRVLPPPNFASPRYLAACREELRRLVPVVLAWHEKLPEEKKHLFVGIKLGHETSIGVNAFHLPDGNALLEKPADEDPKVKLDHTDLPSRGMALTGYAALKTSGIRTSGEPTAAELANRRPPLSRNALRRGRKTRRTARPPVCPRRRLEAGRTLLRCAREPIRLPRLELLRTRSRSAQGSRRAAQPGHVGRALLGRRRMAPARTARNRTLARCVDEHPGRAALPLRLHLQLGIHPRKSSSPRRDPGPHGSRAPQTGTK